MSRPPWAAPFVGRRDEKDRLDAARTAAAGGSGGTVLVTGDAGIGKTRLVSELAQRAQALGARVLLGRCLDLVGSGVPYLAMAEALHPLADSPFRSGPRAGRHRLSLFADVRSALARAAVEAPVVLIVEDTHWADVSTLDMLSYVTTTAAEFALLVVLTAREHEAGERRWFESIRRSPGTLVIELGPLTREELGDLLPPDLPAAFADDVYRRSGGNPFLAQELAAGHGDLPVALREMLLRPVSGLPENAIRVVRTVAASGGALGHAVLGAAVGLPPSRLRAALRAAVAARVLVVETDAFQMRHALMTEAVYGSLLPGEREEIHADLATALSGAGAPAGEVVQHWAAAGRASETFTLSMTAAREAAWVAGPAEALAHLERALALWDTVDSAGYSRADALAAAADHADDIGQGRRAAALVREAITLLDEVAEPGRVALLYERLGSYLFPIGNRAGGLDACRRAVELGPKEPPGPERVRVLSALGHAYMLSGRYAEARVLCEEAMTVAAAMGAPDRAVRAQDVHAACLCHLGEIDAGLEALAAACTRRPDRSAPERLIRPYVLYSDKLLLAGRLGEALGVARAGLAYVRSVGHERSVGNVLAANEAEALLGLGEWDEAAASLAVALNRAGDYWSYHLHLWSAALDTGRGSFAAAGEHLAAAAPARDEPTAIAYHALVAAELAIATERYAEAATAVDEGLRATRVASQPTLTVRLCAVGLRAAALLSTVDAALARQARSAAAHGTPEVAAWLATAEAEHRRDSASWRSAAARWRDLGRRYQAAYADWRLADALVATAGGSAEATQALRRAHDVVVRLGAAPLRTEVELLALRARLHLRPAPAQSAAEPSLGLTAREGEVLRLLALGYTNRDIATELTISVKTASVHVSNILRKLDVPGRVQAAAFARRLSAGPVEQSVRPLSAGDSPDRGRDG